MTASRVLRHVVVGVVALLSSGCRTEPDECERANARLARIQARRSLPASPPRVAAEMNEHCRRGRYARYDPVLRCLIDAPTDEAAASCIDTGIDRVLKPVPADGGRPTGGINPLLDPNWDVNNRR